MNAPDLPQLDLPGNLNYIAVFLTLDCNLGCAYCINDPEQAGLRRDLFRNPRATLAPEEWVRALARIPFQGDLPITLQGGEPMLYRGLGEVLAGLPHHFDLLTNFALRPEQFVRAIGGAREKFMREAPYPSIRVSYHPEEMERAWKGRGFEELVDRCAALADFGFRVSPVKAESDVGIYMVAHPDNAVTPRMEAAFGGRVPFETKEFLGLHEGRLYGTYLYPHSTHLVAGGFYAHALKCECRTTELLVDPLGFVWGCHFHLYESWKQGMPARVLPVLKASGWRCRPERLFPGQAIRPVGHLLDPEFSMDVLKQFRACASYGRCIGCDTKVKNNRFQSLDDLNIAHTSVEIRDIEMPPELQNRLEIQPHQRKFLRP